MYTIRRKFFRSDRTVTLDTMCTLEYAQAWCRDPNSSSRTCTTSEGKRRTKRSGPWFDIYEAY